MTRRTRRKLTNSYILCLIGAMLWAMPAWPQSSGGVPPQIAARLHAIGPALDPAAVGRLYGPLQAQAPKEGVKRTNDVAYGPDARHRLDVYEPVERPAHQAPVLIFHPWGRLCRGQQIRAGLTLLRQRRLLLLPPRHRDHQRHLPSRASVSLAGGRPGRGFRRRSGQGERRAVWRRWQSHIPHGPFCRRVPRRRLCLHKGAAAERGFGSGRGHSRLRRVRSGPRGDGP